MSKKPPAYRAENMTKIESVQRTSQRSFLQGFVPIGTVVLDEEQF
jgi:hypothetical protein